MGQPYVGEIRIFGGNFAPAGWAFCNGQLLAISENETLFNLIGTTYGGDGQSNFGLPNLQSRAPIHFGTGNDGIAYQLAGQGGVEQVTLTVPQLPSHNHVPVGTANDGTQPSPIDGVWAASSVVKPYNTNPATADMGSPSMSQTGGSQPHNNVQPFLCVSFIISLFGIFPSPT